METTRDTTLLTLTLDAARQLLQNLLKILNKSPQALDEFSLSPTHIACVLAHMWPARSLAPLLEQLATKLVSLQCRENVEMNGITLVGAWIDRGSMNEHDDPLDKIYFAAVYPTSRCVEAQGSSRIFTRVSIDKGLEFLGKLVERDDAQELFTDITRLLPVFQAFFTAQGYASQAVSMKTRRWLKRTYELALMMDPQRTSLPTVDIEFGTKYVLNGCLSEEDWKRLSQLASTKVLTWRVKALKWALLFGASVPPALIDEICDQLSSAFHMLINAPMYDEKRLIYWYSLADDLLQLLTSSASGRGRNLALTVVSLLARDRSWLTPKVETESIFSLAIGTGLLFAAESLLR